MFKSRKVNGATRVECRWGGGVGGKAKGPRMVKTSNYTLSYVDGFFRH